MSLIANYYTIQDFQHMMFEQPFIVEPNISAIFTHILENIVIPTETDTQGPTTKSYINNTHSSHQGSEWLDRSYGVRDGTGTGNSISGRKSNYRGGKRGGSGRRDERSHSNTDRAEVDATPFKATKLETKEGIEKEMSVLRSLLNKMSPQKYETQKVAFLEQVNMIMNMFSDQVESNCKMITDILFHIASTNHTLSELYSKLYKELAEIYPQASTPISTYIDTYCNSIHEISYVDPEEDYDKFCKYNKTNDIRKATVRFFIHLMNAGLLDKTRVLLILTNLFSLSREYIDTDGRVNEVDEITENIFLFVTLGKPFLETEAVWMNTVVPAVQELSKFKAKEHKSLSSRVVFKYMDMKV